MLKTRRPRICRTSAEIHILTPGGLSWTRNGVPRDEVAHDHLKRERRAALPEDLARGLPEEFEEFCGTAAASVSCKNRTTHTGGNGSATSRRTSGIRTLTDLSGLRRRCLWRSRQSPDLTSINERKHN
ncbi:hypothetical protein EDB83DRAFT_2340681 [Lactarius deliciosus]|nr:hypothetical protein EDB83DRAFT_2340681 [Lactarius deliciosus]